ncbi:hypothetical protein [Rummeliibacillus pycnus]|uniref:hypothetical protein n=1 Tax=Rummeliibacillus pycnus TaxID=101070 RepID=UPI003D2728E8
MKRIKWLIGIAFIIGVLLTILNFATTGIDLYSKKLEQDVLFTSISLVSQILFLVCIVLGLYWQKHKGDLLMIWVIALSFLALGWNLHFIPM